MVDAEMLDILKYTKPFTGPPSVVSSDDSMEKVQFQLESTLPELKDLHEKGLFAKNEIDKITKRRTAFETSLIRRQTRKEDFFKYAEYEINLETLRKVRYKRLGYDRNPPPPSASTYSIPRRVVYVLKRATAKFPGDLAVWLAYIEYASREGMRKVVVKGLTNALQHHPLSPTLYLLSSFHHLHPTSPFPRSAIPSSSTVSSSSTETKDSEESGFSLEGVQPARTTLLLGLRMVPRSADLWREYIKLELGWVEGLRRRWKVLGISDLSGGKAKEVGSDELVGGEGSFGPDGEDARKAILAGQLVVHAIESALAAIPCSAGPAGTEPDGLSFRQQLLDMLRKYPSPLRARALDVVYEDLGKAAGSGSDRVAARARLLLLTKGLYDRAYVAGEEEKGTMVLSGVPLVEELGKIGKEVRRSAKTGGPDWLEVAGDWLADLVESAELSEDLREFVFSALAALTKPANQPPVALLLRHLELSERRGPTPQARLALAKSHASIHPHAAALQLARLEAEIASEAEPNTLRAIFSSTIKATTRPDVTREEAQAVSDIWMLWMSWEEDQRAADTAGMDKLWKKCMRDSMRIGADVPNLHSILLARYFDFRLRTSPGSPLSIFRELASTYRPKSDFFVLAIKLFYASSQTRNPAAVDEVYQAWCAACQSPRERIRAATVYARACLGSSRPKEATAAVDVLRREFRDRPDTLAELEAEWAALLDQQEAELLKTDEEKEQDVAAMVDQIRVADQQQDLADVLTGQPDAMEVDGNVAVDELRSILV